MFALRYLLTLLCLSACSPQLGPQDVRPEDPLDRKVSAVQLEDETIADAFAKLNAETELSMSVEFMLKDKLVDPNVNYSRFTLRVEGGRLRDVLDRICDLDRQFTWSRYKDTINVYPKASWKSGDAYFLNRQFADIELKEVSDPAQAVFQTVARLPGKLEQVAFIQTGGAPEFPRPWDLKSNDVTVRQAFDEIAMHIGKGHGWSLYGAKESRIIRFHAKILPEPKSGRQTPGSGLVAGEAGTPSVQSQAPAPVSESYVQVTSVTVEPSTIHKTQSPNTATLIVQIMLRGQAPPNPEAIIEVGTSSSDPPNNELKYDNPTRTVSLVNGVTVVKFKAETTPKTFQGKMKVAATIGGATKGTNIKGSEAGGPDDKS